MDKWEKKRGEGREKGEGRERREGGWRRGEGGRGGREGREDGEGRRERGGREGREDGEGGKGGGRGEERRKDRKKGGSQRDTTESASALHIWLRFMKVFQPVLASTNDGSISSRMTSDPEKVCYLLSLNI